QQILERAAAGPFRLTQLARDAGTQLLNQGMNPAGYKQELMWTNPQKRTGDWPDLYQWPAGSAPLPKPPAQLTQQQDAHLLRIQERSLVELMDIIFASGRRSLESLLLALPTTDRITSPAPSQLVQEAADGAIFLFGSHKRLSTHPFFLVNAT